MKFRDLLKAVFTERRSKNTSYSLRAFARDLEISPASLSGILRGVKVPSIRTIRQCAAHLGWSEDYTKKVILDLQIYRNYLNDSGEESVFYVGADFDDLDVSWSLFAIFQLSYLADNSSSPIWISKRLNVSIEEVQKSLDFLLQNKCIEIVEDKMVPKARPVLVSDFRSEKLREVQKNMLKRCESFMSSDHDDLRKGVLHFTLIDPDHLKRFSDLMITFCREIDKLSVPGDNSRLYSVMIQAFPAVDHHSHNQISVENLDS